MAIWFHEKEDHYVVEFDRMVNRSYAKHLREAEGKECRIAHPFKPTQPPLVGVIEEVTIIGPVEDYWKSVGWRVRIQKSQWDFADETQKKEFLKMYTCYIQYSIRGVLYFYWQNKLQGYYANGIEKIEPYVAPPINCASSDWDHKDSIDELLFSKEEVYVNEEFGAHWSDSAKTGCAILIRTSDHNYTELGLSEDGWTYSSDLGSHSEYKLMPLQQALAHVSLNVAYATYNP